ncbi:Hint domain-containing protein [Roseovarius azorensis]|uniref:Hint domain-containing protein n=1 Tax=Roseovarius azorensis TaxID=1287727 RepID=A0A1H7HAS0_9RHOB|nr:Hint domain-containing protein [Roseovarius azorensis]SEK47496.1 Hint domain-containing protein [Roseovarius azorensis]
MHHKSPRNAHSLPVYLAQDFCVSNGANLGDCLSFADELDLHDTYELRGTARLHQISLTMDGAGPFTIARDSAVGRPGAQVHLDCCLTLMSAAGRTKEMLVLVEIDATGHVAEIYAMPLASLHPKTGYALVGIDREAALQKFAQAACVSFTRGTHITMASGAQRRVEELQPGDLVLTRDDGAQPVRWIGQATLRAVGEFAPIRIKAGALNNENDLLVCPDHRLFIYQRSDALGVGRHEVLVRARHLINGGTVQRESGGFVDYYQLLFDAHQIIYAEGIAAETLLIDPRTRAALPADLGDDPIPDAEAHGSRAHLRYEVGPALLDHPDTAALLKRASTR